MSARPAVKFLIVCGADPFVPETLTIIGGQINGFLLQMKPLPFDLKLKKGNPSFHPGTD